MTPASIPAPSVASAPPSAANLAAPDFNHLAPIYRWLEYLTFGPFLWRCRTHFLPQLAHSRQALILGDGDGRFTAHVLRANPKIQVHAIDGSPGMIHCLEKAAAPHRSRLTTEVADLRTWTPAPTESYDLIVTHFFLDCLTTAEVAALARRLNPVPNTLWLVSEFAIPNTLFGRVLAAPLVALLYRAFHLLTGLSPQALPEHASVLAQSGWTLEREQPRLFGLLLSQLWRYTPESHPPACPSS